MDEGVETARAVVESFADMQAPAAPMAQTSDHAYGPAAEHQLRIHRPSLEPGLPVVVYLHGGGFVGGSLTVADEVVRDLARRTGAIVVSATYRRTPEHRFPSAHDDALAALRWVHEHIGEHGGDPTRIALVGDSAGGNLAAATALAATTSVPLTGLVLVYPLVSPTADTPSRQEFARGYVIGLDDLAWFGEQYATAADIGDQRLALDTVEPAELEKLPATLIVTNEMDTLRDEAERFADRLVAAGVDTTTVRSDGLAHGVFWMSLAVARSAEQREAVAGFLAKQLGVTRVD
ncbi:acetyl esterase/lipase [Nocardioides luteus]|uniref:Alpha/beta hydrolase fold-3 domain-containing protein n=1 Tax=Nocardioides luteus TaxID=1844 RepID=A0ABQ5T146_9ACTN|nr:alpha/beta hydrolase [Nocardioides luteus]MDR7313587.1 acetyl esterase/lipase [Nocardioides luteus]GGR69068.1 hypothetical protein GCM10010197_40730 [Nocardioides luteus]GLJ69209.1 hypothetical protein GCM10017579_32450 [Nocardioides luteus]